MSPHRAWALSMPSVVVYFSFLVIMLFCSHVFFDNLRQDAQSQGLSAHPMSGSVPGGQVHQADGQGQSLLRSLPPNLPPSSGGVGMARAHSESILETCCLQRCPPRVLQRSPRPHLLTSPSSCHHHHSYLPTCMSLAPACLGSPGSDRVTEERGCQVVPSRK